MLRPGAEYQRSCARAVPLSVMLSGRSARPRRLSGRPWRARGRSHPANCCARGARKRERSRCTERSRLDEGVVVNSGGEMPSTAGDVEHSGRAALLCSLPLGAERYRAVTE